MIEKNNNRTEVVSQIKIHISLSVVRTITKKQKIIVEYELQKCIRL